ncbi:MAG: BadF/BadG/BcrA/BcrD ATPase family protein [Acidobacteriota bacterium]|nr:BadF/BadG/BcrA/BcrD ATPase family protein [Acidobacteriota bacterium]
MGPFFIGIDGGGTRTRAVVAQEDLVPLGRGASGPANAATRPLPRVVESVREAASDALAAANLEDIPPETVVVGLAGIDSIRDRQPLLSALEAVFERSRVLLTSDAQIALSGAAPGRVDAPAVVVIAGTGAIAFGQGEGGATARAGGFGPLLSDEGGGYAIAREGLVAVVREIDGRGPPTAIKDLLFSTGGVSSLPELLERIYRSEGGAADVAAYFPVVLAAARGGDAEARRILAEAGRDLALDVVTVVRKLGLESVSFPVATIGGVFAAGAFVTNPLVEAIRQVAPLARVGPAPFPPEMGAIRLALATGRKFS